MIHSSKGILTSLIQVLGASHSIYPESEIPPTPIPLCLLSSNWMPHPSNRRFELQVGKDAVLIAIAVCLRSPLIDLIKNQELKKKKKPAQK